MINEWFCTNCFKVWMGPKKCCGLIEKFDSKKHGSKLVAFSNAWISLWKKWEKHPLMTEISDVYTRDGCYSAWIIFDGFIKRLEQKVT